MIAILALGAASGIGCWLVWRSLTRRPSLTDIAATLATPGRAVRAPSLEVDGQPHEHLARTVTPAFVALGLDPRRRAADLRVVRRTPEQHVLRQLAWCLAGAAAGVVVAGWLLGLAPMVSLCAAVVLAGAGMLGPEQALGRDATAARSAFRHALGAYLDLVTVMEAAGAGPETSLYRAAELGDGWAFAEIRSALAAARRARRSTWSALAHLSADLDVPELGELAASLTLVEHEGARIRRSLEARADSMRAQQLADARARAGATTEKMSVPVVLLLVGFLVFVAFPAAVRIGEIGGP